ncbi:MAG: DUF1579 domain-containing protein [Acidobacteriota bacterium]|nr:DUF1579 domain-containing protein [Acidobacteriota bacterium]
MKFIAPLLLIATTAFAQSATDQLKSLSTFVGTWKCSGKTFASEMGPEHSTTATVTGKWILNAKWLEVRYTEEKNSRNPNPYSVVAYWGWDEGQKKLVAGSVDNMGGYSVTQSSGWSGDTLAFEGPSHMGAMTMNGRDSFTRSGDNQISHAFSMPDSAGGWKKLDEETCKK